MMIACALRGAVQPHAATMTAAACFWSVVRTASPLAAASLCHSSASIRSFSSKSPRSRVEQHPQQQQRHKRAAEQAQQLLKQAHNSKLQQQQQGQSDDAETLKQAFTVVDAAQPSTDASSPSSSSSADPSVSLSDPINVSSRLISSEPAPTIGRRPPPSPPTEFDSEGRAILRTKLHPQGAVVGRGRVVANFGTRMLVQEMPWVDKETENVAASTVSGAATKPPAAAPVASTAPASDEVEEGLRFIALPRGKLGKIVCGDLVLWEWASNHSDSSAFIVEVMPRSTEFRRAERGTSGSQASAKMPREEVLLASNFHHMAIVCAVEPMTNATLLDRYISAAQSMRVSTSIIFNKIDLLDRNSSPNATKLIQDMADFESLGIKVFRTSCSTEKGSEPKGIEELRKHLATVGPQPGKGITIFVGQSGSGKSSLLNTLSPSLQLAVNSLSRNAQGRHTTTQTILHTLESGGEIIDSPGFQNFQPAPVPVKEVAQGFSEILRVSKFCHLKAKCMHIGEPGCAVRMALRGAAKNNTGHTKLPGPAVVPAAVAGGGHGEAVVAAPSDPAVAPLLNTTPLSPEVKYFSAFQSTAQAQAGPDWNASVKDMHVPGGEDDPSDAAVAPQEAAEEGGDVARGVKVSHARQMRREMAQDSKRERIEEMQRVEEENQALRIKAVQMGESAGKRTAGAADSTGDDDVDADSHLPLRSSSTLASLAADRAVAITRALAEANLLDSISQRRYRSYVDLVRQQVELEKHKYD